MQVQRETETTTGNPDTRRNDHAFAFCMGMLFGIFCTVVAGSLTLAWWLSMGMFSP